MRVVNRADFLKLPAGTIYCKGTPWAFYGIQIKGDSLPNDWIFLDPAWPQAFDSGAANDLLEQSLADGSSFIVQEDYGRDGCFDDSEVMLIFEQADLLALRANIDAALKVADR
jgi:hypothetical protein